ncbi:amidohydrolase [Siminovitchia fortis]|uniref:Amidohydrolase n=1 Tax=Siminovitchia fortis TaxID=254758 RepID=A0A443IKH6_9BACI|nr:amidohydrolase [Siminovitchia fortis]RWR05288.1 amidohydrolase [Siminovitchia fortis]WHY82435.1 amidohydrolase [Siminovitchia fortis]
MNKKADLILSSNAVFTGKEDHPIKASIAIANKKIIAIGTKEEMKAYADENTKTYDFKDQLITPGFHDFHLHIMQGCVFLNSVNLFDARSEAEAVKMVQEFADSKPDEPWIIGYMWDAGYWDPQNLPTRHSLDQVLPDRPAILFHAEMHYAWVNSKALELANIDKYTKNPEYGEIEKDVNGETTGILYENATSLVTNISHTFTEEQQEKMFENFLAHAASVGVTAVNDMYAPFQDSIEEYKFFKKFEDKDELSLRLYLWPELNGDIEYAKQLRKEYQSDRLRVSGLKQFIDGVVTSRTAYMLEPYADAPETRGETTFSQETYNTWVTEADKEGFAVRFHAIGDGAIRMALDAFEEAQNKNGKRDSRNAIEHVEVIHPDDIGRFNELGVIASMQPDHFAMSERGVYTDRIGKEREKYVFIINTLQKTGAKLAFGTDFPVDILDPMLQIYRAVTRIDNSGKDVWHPHERITLSEALKAYTAGPAYGTFTENEFGTLEVGKIADIAVLDRNLFDIPAEQIKDAQTVLTILDGQVIYEKDSHLKK